MRVRLSSMVLLVGLALTPMPHAAAAPAVDEHNAESSTSARSSTHIGVQRKKGTWDLNGPIPYNYLRPVLRGSTPAARRAFERQVGKIVRAERAALKKWHSGECAYRAGFFQATVERAIYRKRYASVVMRFNTQGCDGVSNQTPRSFTLDLKTRKTVSPKRFTVNTFHARDWAIAAAMFGKYQFGCSTTALADMKRKPRWSAWRVSAAGFTPYYSRYDLAEGACGEMYATVKWRYLAQPRHLRGPSRTAYYLPADPECRTEEGLCDSLRVRARGSVLSIDAVDLEAYGWVGVRSGSRGFFAETTTAYGQFVRFGFSHRDRLKPVQFGSNWRRVSKAQYDEFGR